MLIYNLQPILINMSKRRTLKKMIKINPDTHERLSKLGSKNDTFDDIIRRLLEQNE
jgi:hypothetical protein